MTAICKWLELNIMAFAKDMQKFLSNTHDSSEYMLGWVRAEWMDYCPQIIT